MSDTPAPLYRQRNYSIIFYFLRLGFCDDELTQTLLAFRDISGELDPPESYKIRLLVIVAPSKNVLRYVYRNFYRLPGRELV
jgi:hypothetical protein